MAQCPKCAATVKPETTVCPECGISLAQTSAEFGTLAVSSYATIDSMAPDATIDSVTPNAPGDNMAPDATVDSALTNAQSDNLAPDATIDSYVGMAALTDDDATIVSDSSEEYVTADGLVTISDVNSSSSKPGANDATIDSAFVVAGSAPSVGDDIGTVIFPVKTGGAGKIANDGHGTAVYSESDIMEVKDSRGKSGTAGRLQRMWQGAAGPSANPLHTLQAEGAQASDSVFDRIAIRRVVEQASGDEQVDYEIIKQLGEGAMGKVYAARQKAVDRVVALKMIKAQFQNNDDSKRKFFYEAQITADLDHPNIVPIHELGSTEDGLLFYAMKQISGTEWRDILETKSRDENVDIFMKVSDAVAFAHSKGIIHRDLKPANTMIGQYGEVFVTDWGLAVNLRKSKRFSPGGTPLYMSPEMAGHVVEKIGPASDIYVLGAILYHIVTGSGPHSGKTVSQCIFSALKNEIKPYSKDDPLMHIAMKAMATEPKDRYGSVEEMQVAIREYRRHAESIALSNRAEELLTQAIASKDYERFARTIFGFRDAIELWQNNAAATDGLKRARLAYGQCAFDKGDYDLVLQTVDRSEAAEGKLYADALQAKQVAESREKRFKTMRRAFAAVVLTAVVGLSGLTAFALYSRSEAIFQKGEAERSSELAKRQEKLAFEAAEKEAIEKNNAVLARDEAQKAKSKAELAQQAAEAAKDAEEKQRIAAQEATRVALKAKDDEAQARMNEEKQRSIAESARKEAEQRAAEVQLGEYRANVALVKAQLERFDIGAGVELLNSLKSLDTAEAFHLLTGQDVPGGTSKAIPKFDTWPWQRMNLLSNSDLPRQELRGAVQAVAYAPTANLGVAGMRDGQVHILRFADGGLKISQSYQLSDAKILSVAIAPKGDELVFSAQQGTGHKFFVWPIGSSSQPIPVNTTANRSLQGFAYSPDGSTLVAGINEGLWIWKRNGERWYEESIKPEIRNVRGLLTQIQLFNEQEALVSVDLNGQAVHFVVDLANGDSRRIELPASIVPTAAAHAFGGKQVLVGTRSGGLFTGNYSREKDDQGREVLRVAAMTELLPRQHRTAIEKIEVHPNNELLTLSDEPVVHVWQPTADGSWTYDSYLTGTTRNIANAVFMGSSSLALGVDAEGSSIVWDVQRQKQRRALVPTINGVPDSSAAPVVGVFSQPDSQNALIIDENGVVDLWSLIDGRTSQLTTIGVSDIAGQSRPGQRWSYYGHTPGAQFADSAVDMQAGVVVTSARLDNALVKYLPKPDLAWEFCVWNTRTGEMMHRWYTAKSASGNDDVVIRRLSLLDQGRQVLIASDKEIQIYGLDGTDRVRLSPASAFFAVPNPQDSNQVMVVRRDQILRMVDLRDPSSWRSDSWKNDDLYGLAELPVKGVWTADGRHFYLAQSNGGVARFAWDGNSLKLLWSDRQWEDQKEFIETRKAIRGDGQAVLTHHDMDLAVVQLDSGAEMLNLVTRSSDLEPRTRLLTLSFMSDSVGPAVQRSEVVRGRRWLDSTAGVTGLAVRIHDVLPLDEQRVRSRVRVGGQTFVSTRAGVVFGLTDGMETYVSYGRQALRDASGDRSGRRLLSLLVDGSLWRFELDDKLQASWKPCSFRLPGAEKIQLSPDGQRLLVLGQDEAGRRRWAKVVDAATGADVIVLDGVVAGIWDPAQDASLAVSDGQGNLSLVNGSERSSLPNVPMVTQASIRQLQIFTEAWSDPSKAARKYVLVHAEDDKLGYVHFVPLFEANDLPAAQSVPGSDKLKGVRLVASPTESVFVTGDTGGTVTVWSASPSWDGQARQLFDLEAPRGAAIRALAFSADGKTIITADELSRLFGWMSQDPLHGLGNATQLGQ